MVWSKVCTLVNIIFELLQKDRNNSLSSQDCGFRPLTVTVISDKQEGTHQYTNTNELTILLTSFILSSWQQQAALM